MMTLTNYWWIIGWIFLGGCICIFIPRREVSYKNEKYKIWNIFAASLLALPYGIWAGFRTSAWGDTHAYFEMFEKGPSTLIGLWEYLSSQSKDKGFFFCIAIFKTFIGDYKTLFFLLIAIVQISCLIYIYRNYSFDYWLSIFMFVASGDYMSWFFNGIRQFLIVSILFACTPLLIKKKYLLLIIIILLVSTVHQTALLWIPFLFIVQGKAWNKKTILFIGVVISVVVFLDRFTDIFSVAVENSQYGYELTDMLESKGTSLLRVAFYSIPAICSLLFVKRIRRIDDPLMNISSNMSIAAAGFYVISYFTSGIYIGRIPIYFSLYNYLIYPWVLKFVFTEKSAGILRAGLVFVYLVFFYYQMHVAWNLL